MVITPPTFRYVTTMFRCPHCDRPISVWHKKDAFPCGSCGASLKTNGQATHIVANLCAGFAWLVVFVVPGVECSVALQILVLLAAYAAVYFVIVWVFFDVRLEKK
jgi:hypothetical protein